MIRRAYRRHVARHNEYTPPAAAEGRVRTTHPAARIDSISLDHSFFVMQTLALLRDLFAYDHWANAFFLDLAVPGDSLRLLAHLFASQRIWWSRIQGEEPGIERLPDLSIGECRALAATMYPLWRDYLADCPEERLLETITYTNFEGVQLSARLADILMQVANHGTYHRGQMARALRQEGITPPRTDYIAYVWEVR